MSKDMLRLIRYYELLFNIKNDNDEASEYGIVIIDTISY